MTTAINDPGILLKIYGLMIRMARLTPPTIRASTWKDENPRANAFSFSIVSIGFEPFG